MCISNSISVWISSGQVCFIVTDKTSLEIFIGEQTKTDSVHQMYATPSLTLVLHMSSS